MTDEREYDSSQWIEETGASTGDARENEPGDAGFTDEHDRVFRSHFQRVNRLADRGYEQVRPAYQYGAESAALRADHLPFEEVEKDLENGWLSVRVGGGDWASAREFVRAGYDRNHVDNQGRVTDMTAIGTTGSHDRPSYSDPLASNMDPTDPNSPTEGAEP